MKKDNDDSKGQDFPGKAVSKGTKDNDPSVEARKEKAAEDDAMGHVTGGEAVDANGCIDSTQSAKPVPRDALKMDIPAGAQAPGLGNVAQPGHDNAKLAEGEDAEDAEGECEDEDCEDCDDEDDK